MSVLHDDRVVARRLLDHIAAGTTDVSEATWREPVAHYRSAERFEAEVGRVLRRRPVALCPSAALPEAGSYLAADAAGTPLVAVRGRDGVARAFRNACRHRGAAVACGSGTAGALVCPYHGWTYRLDGRLRHVPHGHGFPGVDAVGPDGADGAAGAGGADRGLVAVATAERHGLVLVDQHARGPLAPDATWDELDGLLPPSLRLVDAGEAEEPVNWKVLVETFLEGYHIRSLHRTTFFPVQYDNVTLVEAFGPHSRLAFPYRALARLADVPPDEWSVAGRLTYVYHLFPNVVVATFPTRVLVVVIDPVAVDRTRVVTYTLAEATPVAEPARRTAEPGRDHRALLAAGAAEDFAVARTVQRGLSAGANTHLEFGLFEGAIAHFHRTLDRALDQAPAAAPADPVAVGSGAGEAA